MATCSSQVISKYFEAYTNVDGLTFEPYAYKPHIKVIRRNGHDVFITRDNRKTWGYKHYKHCKLIAGHRDAFVATRKMRS